MSDSTPLIHLEKDDAAIIKEHIGKSIHVKSARFSSKNIAEKYSIHKGEAESILLALKTNALLLMNERIGRNAAKSEGIKVKGTIGVLFDALRAGVINKEEVLSILSRFSEYPHDF